MTNFRIAHLARTFAALTLLLGMALGFTSASQAQTETPTIAVQSTIDNILAILRKPDFSLDADRAAISTEIARAFDATAMAQSVLSTNWRQANAQQQEEFRNLLMQTIENTYIGRLRTYSNESVEIQNEEIKDNRASVSTAIITSSGNVPVVYKLRKRSDGWFVYDVEIENVSMVSTYRDTYRSVVSRDGLDGLLTQMRAKLAELTQGEPG